MFNRIKTRWHKRSNGRNMAEVLIELAIDGIAYVITLRWLNDNG